MRLGADRFLRKPVEMDVLLAVVADLLRQKAERNYTSKASMDEAFFSKAHVKYVLHGLERKTSELEYLLQKQKDTEAALRESEARYRRISSLASDYFYQLDVTEEGTWVVGWIGISLFKRKRPRRCCGWSRPWRRPLNPLWSPMPKAPLSM